MNRHSLREQSSRAWLYITTALLAPGMAAASPVGGTVAAGSAAIAQSANTTTITQSTDRAILNWQSFDVNAGERVQFQQPSAQSVTLNRINSQNASQIHGQISANGTVFLINPNGVVFGSGAQVNVGSLVASTANVSDANFMAGRDVFDAPGVPTASIENHGSITVADVGLVALVAPTVKNSGVITARLGTVNLGAGDTFTLDLYGDGLINLEASPAVQQQLVEHSGEIHANGGTVRLSTAAAAHTLNSLINMDGLIVADSASSSRGHVSLHAGHTNGTSTVMVRGTVSAQGVYAGEHGGHIEVLGDRTALLNGALLDASGSAGGGIVLLGGDYQGQGATPTSLMTVMQAGSVIRANAIDSGDGGKVIVWADNTTRFEGTIEARALGETGDGGFVETSGKALLIATGNVNAASRRGRQGIWLLDPNDITINATADTNVSSSGANPVLWDTTDDSAVVTVASILNSLDNGTDVTIQTGTAGTNAENGDITVASAISKTGGGDATLTLKAHRNIIINGAISSSSNKLHLVLNANAHDGGAGYVSIGANIGTNGGNITIGGGSNISTGYAIGISGQEAGVLVNNKTVSAEGGNVIVRGQGYAGTNNNYGVLVTGASGKIASTNSGTVDVTGVGQGNGTNNYGVYVNSAGNITTVNGALTVNGQASTTGTQSGVGVFVNNGNSKIYSTGTGAVSVTGTGGGTGQYNYGVYVQLATSGISSSSTGNVTVQGTASSSTVSGQNYGIYVFTGSITSAGGNVQVTGAGKGNGGSATNGGHGVALSTSSSISTTSSGTVSVTGSSTGTNTHNYGIYLTGTSTITAVNGSVTVQGTGSGSGGGNGYGVSLQSGGNITSTGSGAITITGIGGSGGANNHGIHMATGTNSVGGASASGNLTLTANSWSLANTPTIQTTGTITVKPYTAGTTMGIGTGSGAFAVTDTDIGYLNWGAANFLYLGAGQAGAMEINSAFSFTKPVEFRTQAAANITIAGQISSSYNGTAVVVASGNNLVNSFGATAINLTGGGRFLTYSTNPASDTLGGMTANFRRFSCTYGGSCPSLGSGNGFLYSYTPTLTATPSGVSITYGDAVPSLAGYSYALTGYLGSDSSADNVTGSLTGTTTYTQGSSVGSYNINHSSGSLSSAMGYDFSYANNATAITVGKKALTAVMQNQTITYGAATPTLSATNSSHVVFSGFYSSFGSGDTAADIDSVTFSYGGATATAIDSAGSYTLSISAFSDNNYSLALPAGVTTSTLTINPRALTITATDQTKTYANDALGSSAFTSSGLQNSETIGSVTLTGVDINALGTSSSGNRNVGTWRITPSAATGGTFTASNYTITYVNGALTLNQKALTITGVTASNKTYDATTAATLDNTSAALSGVVVGDTVTLGSGSSSATFSQSNVGTGLSVTAIGYTTGGADNGNYSLSQPSGLTADITKKTITATLQNIDLDSGDLTPTLSGSNTAHVVFSGLAGADTGADIDSITFDYGGATAGNADSAGTYTLSLSAFSDNNYDLSLPGGVTTGTLTISAAASTTTGGQEQWDILPTCADNDSALKPATCAPAQAAVSTPLIRFERRD